MEQADAGSSTNFRPSIKKALAVIRGEGFPSGNYKRKRV
jgi:hypothetical protein